MYEETLGTVAVEIRDLLKQLVAPPPAIEVMSVVPRPKATGYEHGSVTLSTAEMKDIVRYKAKEGAKLSPTLAIVRVRKAAIIDVCLTPVSPAKSEIIAVGTAPDDGIFVHWFPYGIYTIGSDEVDRMYWVRAQGITETGTAEAVIMFEEIGKR